MSFLTKFDIFKQPVQLSLNKDSKVSTHFGKLVTFFMVFYTTYTFLQSDLVLKKNPTIKVENFRPYILPHTKLDRSNFTFAVGLYDLKLGYIFDPTMFSFVATLSFYNNTTNDIIERSLELDLCKEEDFINAGENFKRTLQTNLFCFQLNNETIDLFGSLNEEANQMFYLDLNGCKNSSENNFTCKSIEEQKAFFQSKYEDFIYQNDAIDYSNYYSPLKKDVRKNYILIDSYLAKTLTLFIKHFSILSDNGFFFENMERQDSYTIESIVYDFEGNNLNEKESKPLVRLDVYPDGQTSIHSRKYQHIQDLLAEMGGVLNIFVLVGILIINIEVPYIMTKKISSELYTYNIEKNEREKNDIPTENEERKGIFDLSGLNSYKSSEITKTHNLTEFSPRDLKSIVKKVTILQNEHLDESKDLSISSVLQTKENEINPNLLPKENFNYSIININGDNSYFTVKMPTSRGDEDMVYEKSPKCANDNIRVQRRSRFSSTNTSKIIKSSFMMNNVKKKLTLMESAVKFSSDLKKKLNFRRLLEHHDKKGKKNFPINFLSYLSILFKCKKFKLNQKEKLFLLGEQQIKKDLDIFKIINCMNDVEKLKMILLNDQQRYLFDLLQKPIITTKHINQELEKNTLIVDGSKKRVRRSIVETIYKDLISNATKSDIDKRILHLVDKNLVNVNEIQFNEHE